MGSHAQFQKVSARQILSEFERAKHREPCLPDLSAVVTLQTVFERNANPWLILPRETSRR
jgi:hypothetical protein